MSPIATIEALAATLEADTTRVRIVIFDELPGTVEGRAYDSYGLELTPGLESRFRRNIARTIRRWPPTREWSTYDPGYVPDAGEVSRGPLDLISDSPLPAAVDRGAQPDRIRLPAATEVVTPGIHGYAVILIPRNGPRFVVVRRLDPVERLSRGRITAFIHENRLTDSEQTLAFDSGVDVLLASDEVVIGHFAAFEAMFFPAAVRSAAAVAVVRDLSTRIEIVNLGDLEAVAGSDSIFGGRLRRFSKSEALTTVTIERIRASLQAFGWERRFLEGDRLRFDPSGKLRWPFLAALEDGLTQSPGSGRLYRANSQRYIPRRQVTNVVTATDGSVTHISGPDWGPLTAEDVREQIDAATASFYVGPRAEAVEVLPSRRGVACPVEAVDDDGVDRLPTLPTIRLG